jgi:hypothetical protein
MVDPPPPPGSYVVASWAGARGYPFQYNPDDSWYRAWEPFDTLVAPARYLNAVATSVRRARLVVVEPWMAYGDDSPVARTLFAFVRHPAVRGRASMHIGGSHVTRVTFLHSPPPPRQRLGDEVLDPHATVYAPTPADVQFSFPAALRAYLRDEHFEGHLEVRPGGFVLHRAHLDPNPGGYERLLAFATEALGRLVLAPSGGRLQLARVALAPSGGRLQLAAFVRHAFGACGGSRSGGVRSGRGGGRAGLRFGRGWEVPEGCATLGVFAPVAQSEEQEISNLPVAGSIPAGRADRKKRGGGPTYGASSSTRKVMPALRRRSTRRMPKHEAGVSTPPGPSSLSRSRARQRADSESILAVSP